MNLLIEVVKDDKEQYEFLYGTLFDKMHLSLNSISVNRFRYAESQIELLKILVDIKEAQEVFVGS
jgi:hypothetical protein